MTPPISSQSSKIRIGTPCRNPSVENETSPAFSTTEWLRAQLHCSSIVLFENRIGCAEGEGVFRLNLGNNFPYICLCQNL